MNQPYPHYMQPSPPPPKQKFVPAWAWAIIGIVGTATFVFVCGMLYMNVVDKLVKKDKVAQKTISKKEMRKFKESMYGECIVKTMEKYPQARNWDGPRLHQLDAVIFARVKNVISVGSTATTPYGPRRVLCVWRYENKDLTYLGVIVAPEQLFGQALVAFWIKHKLPPPGNPEYL